MKLVKCCSFLFSLLMLNSATLVAQSGDSLKVTYVSGQYPQCPDTALTTSFYQGITVSIKNLRVATAFTGNLQINFKTANDSLATDSLSLNSGQVFTIPANDSINLTLVSSYVFSTSVYRLGSSVVVVWPVTNIVGLKVDSTYLCLNLATPNSINDNFNVEIGHISNPVKEQIQFSLPFLKWVERVRIYDATGRNVFAGKILDNAIPVSFLKRGVYFLEVEGRNNQFFRKQFLKE